MQIERIDIDQLCFDPANARKHSPKNLDAIKGSLARFGQQKPIVVGKNNVVIAGNGTLEAAKALGWTEIQVARTDLEGTDATAYAIADNRTGELADWDAGVLSETLKSLQEMDFDLGAIGFDDDDLEKMIASDPPSEGLTDPDEVPAQVETRCKPGDLWLLGNHRLLCGDSTNVQHVERLMGGEKPLLMVTDPPYGVEYDAEWRGRAGHAGLGKNRTGKVSADDNADWTPVWAISGAQIAYIWHASAFSDVVLKSLRDSDYDVRQQIIWNKSVMIMSRSAYHWKHEPCWYAVKKGCDGHWVGDRKQVTVWDAAPPNHIMGGSKEERTPHPTQKPLAVYEIPIANHTRPGDLLYEPFAGSGTAIMAAERSGRRCFGMELDAKYCDVILARWEAFTGKQANLANKVEINAEGSH